jgi:translation initiation factor 1 (eIF-1/SUI1)
MPELTATLVAKRNKDHEDKKFFAAIQGVDLDEESGKGQKEWEDLKARVYSGGKSSDSNDIISLQGQNASKAGFGIGTGLEYTDMTTEPLGMFP